MSEETCHSKNNFNIWTQKAQVAFFPNNFGSLGCCLVPVCWEVKLSTAAEGKWTLLNTGSADQPPAFLSAAATTSPGQDSAQSLTLDSSRSPRCCSPAPSARWVLLKRTGQSCWTKLVCFQWIRKDTENVIIHNHNLLLTSQEAVFKASFFLPSLDLTSNKMLFLSVQMNFVFRR